MRSHCESGAICAQPQIGENRQLLRASRAVLLRQKICLFGSYGLRGGASTRLQPKRRASTDHKPGPNMARAAPVVPNISHSHLSPDNTSIFPTSVRATEAPAMGVHKPAMSRIPAPIKSMAGSVTFIEGSTHRIDLCRTTSADPTTQRRRSNPTPGQPPANVEYRRRKHNYDLTLVSLLAAPKRAGIITH
jgi:hypothetical protein